MARELVVVSGKGGTGKTSLVGSFAVLAGKRAVLADCDVDAADLSIITRARIVEERVFQASRKAVIQEDKCARCDRCVALCRWGAITDYRVDHFSCEGCGVCYHVCPHGAVRMEDRISGHLYVSATPYGPLVHARLKPGEENSGRLVSLVKKRAREIAEREETRLIIIDGPPGIGCPVISSLSGSSLALIVTEPTLSGIHDLARVWTTCRYFNVPALVCINRWDLEEENTRHIEAYCRDEGIEPVMRISFDQAVTRALVQRIPVVEYTDGSISGEIARVWELVEKALFSA